MPFKSKAQQRYLFATKPETAKLWAEHTPDFKKLPERVGEKEKETEKKGFDSMNIAQLATQAAENSFVEKLASDSEITPALVQHLANMTKLPTITFVKLAYRNPDDYINALKLASGVTKTAAGNTGALASRVLAALKGAVSTAPSKGVTRPGKLLDALTPGLGKSQALRTATGVAGAGAIGTGGAYGISELASEPPTAASAASGPPVAPEPLPEAPKPPEVPPSSVNGPSANPPTGRGGLSPAGKAGIAAGGVGLGALGTGAYMRKRKQKKQKEVAATDTASLGKQAMRAAIVKKAAQMYQKQAAARFVSYLDALSALIPLEKTAQVRKLQTAILEGKPLSHAIKLAYPTLNGEQRGILGAKLCKAAAAKPFGKKKMPFKVLERQEDTVKVKDNNITERMKDVAGM